MKSSQPGIRRQRRHLPDANGNLLLASLPVREQRLLIAGCERVELQSGSVLSQQHRPIRQIYFPTGGVISLLAQIDRRPSSEVGLVGREGAVGAVIALGVRTAPVSAIVQGTGSALSIDATQFVNELARCPELKRMVSRYLFVFVSQLAATVSCGRFHLLEARVARWLLLTRDRQCADVFFLTHEFMAHMLGVRRVGVTRAAHGLRTRELVSYSRGYIRILDVPGLEAAACSCYAANRATYARVMRVR